MGQLTQMNIFLLKNVILRGQLLVNEESVKRIKETDCNASHDDKTKRLLSKANQFGSLIAKDDNMVVLQSQRCHVKNHSVI